MADTLAQTFDPAKGYRKVIFQQKRPVMDFELNEAQDILRYDLEQTIKKISEGTNLIGGSGSVIPSSTTHSVDVEGGIAVHNDELIRIPSVTDFSIFPSGAVGTHSRAVFVEWWDEEIDSTEDPDLLGDTYSTDTFGESAVRTKRHVVVHQRAGTGLPSMSPNGGNLFLLADVVHDFSNGNMVLQSDIDQRPRTASASWTVSNGVLSAFGKSVSWGGGSAIPDSTKVARRDIDNVFLGHTIYSRTSGGRILHALLESDSNYRWSMTVTGTMEWGSGTAALDTNLYRSGPGVLKTDGDFEVGERLKFVKHVDSQYIYSGSGYVRIVNGSTTYNIGQNTIFADIMDTSAQPHLGIETKRWQKVWSVDGDFSGTLQWGGGAAIASSDDVALLDARNSFSDSISVDRDAASIDVPAFSTHYGEYGNNLFEVGIRGKMEWGYGSAPPDTNLYRSDVGILKTDGDFVSEGNYGLGASPREWYADYRAVDNGLGGLVTSNVGLVGLWQNVFTDAAGQIYRSDDTKPAARYYMMGEHVFQVAPAGSGNPQWTRALIIANDGKATFSEPLAWGGGAAIASSDDVAEKDEINVFTTEQYVRRDTTSLSGFLTQVAGETAPRWKVRADGFQEWGDGTGHDVSLYRSSAGTLKTDGDLLTGEHVGVGVDAIAPWAADYEALEVGGGGALSGDTSYGHHSVLSANAYASTSAGQWNYRTAGRASKVTQYNGLITLDVASAGIVDDPITWVNGLTINQDASAEFGSTLAWGGGAAIASSDDVALITKQNVYKIGQVVENTVGSGNGAFFTRVEGDAIARFGINTDGVLDWGDGTNDRDVNLYRFAAGILKTDDSVVAVGNITAEGTVAIGGTTTPMPHIGLRLDQTALRGQSTQVGLYSSPVFSADATVQGMGLQVYPRVEAAAFTMDTLKSLSVRDANVGIGASVTAQYGLYIEGLDSGGTNYAIYTDGDTPSHFGGNIETDRHIRLSSNVSWVMWGDTNPARIRGSQGTGLTTGLEFQTSGNVAMHINGAGNVGIGSDIIEPWQDGWTAVQLGAGAFISGRSLAYLGYFGTNSYYDSGWRYLTNGSGAAVYDQNSGVHQFRVAGVGAAKGDPITWTTALALNTDGSAVFGATTSAPNFATPSGGRVYFNGAGSTEYFEHPAGTNSIDVFAGGNVYRFSTLAFRARTPGMDLGAGGSYWATVYAQEIDLGDSSNPRISLASSNAPSAYRTDIENNYDAANPFRIHNYRNNVTLLRLGQALQMHIAEGADYLHVGANIRLVSDGVRIQPGQTGGWANGMFYEDSAGTRLGGFVAHANDGSLTRLSIAHGNTPWGSSVGMHVHSDGVVSIGTTGKSGSGRTVQISGEAEATAFFETSTREAKTNIRPFIWGGKSALEYVDEIEIVRFNYREGWTKDTSQEHISFIAEDTDPLFSGPRQKSFATKNVVSLLVKAAQELRQENKELREAVSTCRAQVQSIEERLAAAGI